MRGRGFIKKWSDEQVKMLVDIQEMFTLAGCAFCARRLVKDGVVIEGVRVVYQQGPFGPALIGDVCCNSCFEELFCDNDSD